MEDANYYDLKKLCSTNISLRTIDGYLVQGLLKYSKNYDIMTVFALMFK